MNGMEWNKLAFALVVSGLVMGIANVTGQHIVKADPPSPSILSMSADKKTVSSSPESIDEWVSKGDAHKGQGLAAIRCGVCHTFTPDETNTVGPALHNSYMRPIASLKTYDYSDALTKLHADKWNSTALWKWLKAPMTFAPGTKMVFAGINDEQERADIIAYLRSISSSPSASLMDKH